MIKVSGQIRAGSQRAELYLRIAYLALRLQNIPNKMKDTEVMEYIEEVRDRGGPQIPRTRTF